MITKTKRRKRSHVLVSVYVRPGERLLRKPAFRALTPNRAPCRACFGKQTTCEHREAFKCETCRKWRSWEYGAWDDRPGDCDGCWAKHHDKKAKRVA